MISERKCLECGDVLHGRADQKYCSDQCRNAFHNKRLGVTSNTIRRINRILRKNQALLAGLNNNGTIAVSKSELIQEGFNFNYFTNLFTTHHGRTCYFCYDQGYSMAEGNKVLLVRKKQHVS